MKNKLLPVFLLSSSIFLGYSCQENFESRLQREAREFTASHCPEEVEPGCILDSINFNPDTRTYTWWYSLSATGVMVFRQNEHLLHQMLTERLRNDVELKALKKEKISFGYVYRSQQGGNVVYQTTISPTEYSIQK